MDVTVTIMAYNGSWPVGIATRQGDGMWLCRVLEDRCNLEIRTELVRTERSALMFLKKCRWSASIKEIKMPIGRFGRSCAEVVRNLSRTV